MEKWFDLLIKKHYPNKFDYVDALYGKGYIYDFEIKNNVVSAIIVDGEDERNVKVTFKKFSKSEINKLNKIIDNNNQIYYKLSINQIPHELFNNDVKIFPDSIDDFKFNHESSDDLIIPHDVIILLKRISKEIIEDPFLIFSLRGIDLKKSLPIHIKTIDEIFENNFKSDSDDNEVKDLHDINVILLKNIKNKYNGLEFIYDEIFEGLRSYVIINGISSKKYVEFIKLRSFKISDFDSQDNFEELFRQKWEVSKINIDINSKYKMSKVNNIKNEKSLFSFLNEFSQVKTENFDYSINFFHELLFLTYKLVKNNAIVPQIFALPNNRVQLRWIPQLCDDATLNFCKIFYSACPDDLITYCGEYISKENQVLIAISLIMNGFIQYYLQKDKIKKYEKHMSGSAMDLFQTKTVELKSDYRKNIADEIANVISPFYMKELDFNFVVMVYDDFEVEIKIKNDGGFKSTNDANLVELKYLEFIYNLFTIFNIKNELFEKFTLSDYDFLVLYKLLNPLFKRTGVEVILPFEVDDNDLTKNLNVKYDNKTILKALDNFYKDKFELFCLSTSFEDFIKIHSSRLNIVFI